MEKKSKDQTKLVMAAQLRSILEPHKSILVKKFGADKYDAVFAFKSDRETVQAMLRLVTVL